MNPTARICNPHRFARLLAWARAMLAWMSLMLLAPVRPTCRRRIRQRHLSLDQAEVMVRALAMARAVDLARLRQCSQPPLRNGAAPGFRRRIARAALRRATVGARFRKALRHRDPGQRLKRLIAALADIDAFARRLLVPRALRGLTRLRPLVMSAPPAIALAACAAPAPRGVDTS